MSRASKQLSWLHSIVCVIYYSIVVWFKKPQLPALGFYSYHVTSQYKVITIVFIILIAAETVAMHFLLRIWSDWLAWFATALSIYTVLYLTSTYNAYRYLPHLLDEERLIIRLGFQNSAEIALANITRITPAKQIGLGESRNKETFYAHLPFDAPHFEIHLKEPIEVKGLFAMKAFTSIVLYADQHKELEAELNNLTRAGEPNLEEA